MVDLALDRGKPLMGFRTAFAWAMRQNFPDDYAARVRREAWSEPELVGESLRALRLPRVWVARGVERRGR